MTFKQPLGATTMIRFALILTAAVVAGSGYFAFTHEQRQMQAIKECILRDMEFDFGPDMARTVELAMNGAFESMASLSEYRTYIDDNNSKISRSIYRCSV